MQTKKQTFEDQPKHKNKFGVSWIKSIGANREQKREGITLGIGSIQKILHYKINKETDLIENARNNKDYKEANYNYRQSLKRKQEQEDENENPMEELLRMKEEDKKKSQFFKQQLQSKSTLNKNRSSSAMTRNMSGNMSGNTKYSMNQNASLTILIPSSPKNKTNKSSNSRQHSAIASNRIISPKSRQGYTDEAIKINAISLKIPVDFTRF